MDFKVHMEPFYNHLCFIYIGIAHMLTVFFPKTYGMICDITTCILKTLNRRSCVVFSFKGIACLFYLYSFLMLC